MSGDAQLSHDLTASQEAPSLQQRWRLALQSQKVGCEQDCGDGWHANAPHLYLFLVNQKDQRNCRNNRHRMRLIPYATLDLSQRRHCSPNIMHHGAAVHYQLNSHATPSSQSEDAFPNRWQASPDPPLSRNWPFCKWIASAKTSVRGKQCARTTRGYGSGHSCNCGP